MNFLPSELFGGAIVGYDTLRKRNKLSKTFLPNLPMFLRNYLRYKKLFFRERGLSKGTRY